VARLAIPILLALAGAALVAPPARAQHLYLDVDSPLAGDVIKEPLGLCEVKGWAGTGLRGKHDVVIVLDRSGSTFRSTGKDVDGDGVIGRDYFPEPPDEIVTWTSDFGDTIVSAEILAARRLIERLDSETTRMAIVSFGGNADVDAPLGSTREQLLAALDRMPPRPNQNGTNFYEAIETAIAQFQAAAVPPGERRNREILLLSDGVPVLLDNPPAAAQLVAVQAARNAAKARARIYAYALGPIAGVALDKFREIDAANGGELLVLDQPSEIVEFVPYLSWTEIAKVELKNTTTGEPGRAVRLFPDGSFDGYAPLTLGKNELELTAISQNGARTSVTRAISFERSPADPERLAKLKRELEVRSVETERYERARAKREERLQKQLEIKAEPEAKPKTP